MEKKNIGGTKLVMPMQTFSVEYFRLALKVCAAHPDGIRVDDFKDELFNELKLAGLETVKNSDDSFYSQCLQLPRYFGFVRYCLSNERGNAITARGRAMLCALSSKPVDGSSIISLLFDAIVQNRFGRDNEGVETDSYCEPLAILFRAADRLNGISNSEFGYLIEQMDQNGRPFRKVIEEIQKSRSAGIALPIAKESQAEKIKDWTTILWMEKIGFLSKDEHERVTISPSIPEEKKSRLNTLPLYNPGFLKWLFTLKLKSKQLDQSVENYPRSLEAMSEDFGEKNSSKFDGFFKRLTGHLPRKKVFEVFSLSEYDSVFEELNYFWEMDEAKGFSPFPEDGFYECFFYAKAKMKIDQGRLRSACNKFREFLTWWDATKEDFEINNSEETMFKGSLGSLQEIHYGAPGTGKSNAISSELINRKIEPIRITFHPDSDYASFVGCYKPATETCERAQTNQHLTIDRLAEILKAEYASAGEGSDKGKATAVDLFAEEHVEYLDGQFGKVSLQDLVAKAGLPKGYSVGLRDSINVAKHKAKQRKGEKRIVYRFVPQAFAKAYAQAWAKMAEAKDGEPPAPQVLVIEEINRGNCAQVFGDLFQLLDRDDATGYSSYPVDPDADLASHLHDWFRGDYKDGDGTASPTIVGTTDGDKWKSKKAGTGDAAPTWYDVFAGRKLVLPPNLYIWATMNTSDQSLFPMDSAFKRRWDWKYEPIRMPDKKEDGTDWEDWTIRIPANAKVGNPAAEYAWWDFLTTINRKIGDLTSSEDKKLGYFFVKGDSSGAIPLDAFVNKVVFYLWNDAFRAVGAEELGFEVEDTEMKKDGTVSKKKRPAQFEDFFAPDGDPDAERVREFLSALELDPKKTDAAPPPPAPAAPVAPTPGGTP